MDDDSQKALLKVVWRTLDISEEPFKEATVTTLNSKNKDIMKKIMNNLV